jgi:hypothetical protein
MMTLDSQNAPTTADEAETQKDIFEVFQTLIQNMTDQPLEIISTQSDDLAEKIKKELKEHLYPLIEDVTKLLCKQNLKSNSLSELIRNFHSKALQTLEAYQLAAFTLPDHSNLQSLHNAAHIFNSTCKLIQSALQVGREMS